MEADWINESKKIYFAEKKKAFRPGAELAWKVVRHAPKWIQESDPRQVSSTSVAPGLAEQPKDERPIGQKLAKKRGHESSYLASDDSKYLSHFDVLQTTILNFGPIIFLSCPDKTNHQSIPYQLIDRSISYQLID